MISQCHAPDVATLKQFTHRTLPSLSKVDYDVKLMPLSKRVFSRRETAKEAPKQIRIAVKYYISPIYRSSQISLSRECTLG
jgi:hypothetical protein